MSHIGNRDETWAWGGSPEHAMEQISTSYEEDIKKFKSWLQENIDFYQSQILNREASYEMDEARKSILEKTLKKFNEIF
jgi:hypothetical protein